MRHFPDSRVAEGSPAAIRSQAQQMINAATRIDTVAGMLQKVSTRGSWESPAGDTFASKVGGTPSDLFTVANRLRTSAQIIRPYADLLEASQRACSDCDASAHSASTTLRRKDEELEGMAQDDPDRARVQRERGEAAVDLTRAERRFEREEKEAYADESRMAAKLHEVCEQDEDPVLYDYFEWMTNAGGKASDVGIIAKPIALAGVIEPIGMAGRRAVYGEGSYTDVAKASAGYGVDTVGFGAGRVVKKAKQRFTDPNVSRVQGLESNPVRIKDNPITTSSPPTAATHSWAARKAKVRHPKGHYPPGPSRIPASVRDFASRHSGVDDISEAFTDWELIAGQGRVAKVAVTVRASTKQTSRVRKTVKVTSEQADKGGMTSDARDPNEEQHHDQQRREETARRMTDNPGTR